MEPHLPSDLQIQPASFSVDLNPLLQNVTSGVSSDSSCGDGADAPHSDGASAPSDVNVDASHGEASHSRIVDNGLPDSIDVGTPFDAETDSPSAVDFDATHVEASLTVVDDGPPDTNEVGSLAHPLMLRQTLPVLYVFPTRFRKEYVINQILLLVRL